MPTRLAAHFTLDSISGLVKEFGLPEGRFDPEGPWRSVYGVYTLAGRGGRAGRLDIERKDVSEEDFVLKIAYEKALPGHTQRVAAEMHCRCDELATPLRWTFSSEISDRSGNLLANTRLKNSAAATKDYIEITKGKRKERIAVESGCTVNWALFDAVQRLPREIFTPIKFSMLDHFDQFKGGQIISYREMIDVTLEGQAVRLHGFDHLGEGIVPWVYWVNDQGLLLFAVSGLEGYLLEKSD